MGCEFQHPDSDDTKIKMKHNKHKSLTWGYGARWFSWLTFVEFEEQKVSTHRMNAPTTASCAYVKIVAALCLGEILRIRRNLQDTPTWVLKHSWLAVGLRHEYVLDLKLQFLYALIFKSEDTQTSISRTWSSKHSALASSACKREPWLRSWCTFSSECVGHHWHGKLPRN